MAIRAFFALQLLLLFIVSPAASVEPLFPQGLKPGDTILFVAPSGPLDQTRVDLARKRLEQMGFVTKASDDLYRKTGFLAGHDATRVQELNQAFADPGVDAIFPGTGGYGASRILDRLDYDVIRANPKILVGFSDITALHLAVNKMTGLVTFHSPNPMWGLGSEDNLTAYSAHWFWQAILAKSNQPAANGYTLSALNWHPASDPGQLQEVCQLTPPVTLAGGVATGRLIGGNLSLVSALMGTPYEIDTQGKILFLEDIGEAPYRVDRMLCTLKLAGKLTEVSGVILGQFTRRKTEDTSDEVTTMDEVLDSYFSESPVPVIKNFPLGHHRCNATLPIGVLCELNADKQTIRLLERPVR